MRQAFRGILTAGAVFVLLLQAAGCTAADSTQADLATFVTDFLRQILAAALL